MPAYDFVILDGYTKEEICTFIDDMLHEDAKPGEEVRLIQSERPRL